MYLICEECWVRHVWNSTLGCGCLFRLVDLDLMFSDRLNQDERTTTRWRNGYPSTTSVCTSIHGPISSDILVLSVWEWFDWSLLRGVCVWGVGVWRWSGFLREWFWSRYTQDHGWICAWIECSLPPFAGLLRKRLHVALRVGWHVWVKLCTPAGINLIEKPCPQLWTTWEQTLDHRQQ